MHDSEKQSAQLKPLRAKGQNPEIAIPLTLVNYLEPLDWSGKAIRPNKRGHISKDVPPILERLSIDADERLKTMDWNNRFFTGPQVDYSLRGRTQNKQGNNCYRD